MNKRIFILIFGIGTFVFVSFQATVNFQDPWKAPVSTDTLRNPYPVRWGANTVSPAVIAEGTRLYNTYCVACHGKNGLGDGAPGMTFAVKPANFHDKAFVDQKDGNIFWKISEGRGIMPPFKTVLTDANRWAVVAHIRRLIADGVGVADVSKAKASLPVNNYVIDPKIPKTAGQYFPLPTRVKNAFSSESQLFMVDTLATGLLRPWSVLFLPDNTVLIAERNRLLRVKNGKVQPTPIGGNIPKELRDMKLHPDYAKNGWIYLTHHIDPVRGATPTPGYSVLMRARLRDDKLVDQEVLYKAGPLNQGAFWYGSRVAFDKDGYLFMTVGIVGPRTNAQDLSSIAGKTLRLKDDGSIPADNPFAGKAGALPEIYSYGHRVHEGLVYDRKTDKLYSTEFGEMGGDELNIIKRGANYGWPEVTFSLEYSGGKVKESKDSVRADVETPVGHWTIAPGNVEVVNGDRYPSWDGNVFVGAMSKTEPRLVRAVVKNGTLVHDEILLKHIGRIREVKYGPDKFLYLLTEDTGLMVRLVPLKKK